MKKKAVEDAGIIRNKGSSQPKRGYRSRNTTRIRREPLPLANQRRGAATVQRPTLKPCYRFWTTRYRPRPHPPTLPAARLLRRRKGPNAESGPSIWYPRKKWCYQPHTRGFLPTSCRGSKKKETRIFKGCHFNFVHFSSPINRIWMLPRKTSCCQWRIRGLLVPKIATRKKRERFLRVENRDRSFVAFSFSVVF